jgi:flagella basal body P-ring formation protein FlgA
LTLGARAETTEWQSPESVRAAARALVLRTIGAAETTNVETTSVDERLRLPRCSVPLDAQLQQDLVSGRGTVAVAFPGTTPRRLFVPVRVVEQVGVVVARRTLAAGDVLTAEDLEIRTQASTSLPMGFITDPAAAIGLTLKRTVPAGTLLAPAALVHPQVIERGALVPLVSGSGPIKVKSEGTALESARIKDRVRVKSASGRIVEGVVEASGEVRVGT